MSDVRLTATNPEDSSAVPVACNAKGELLLEEIPDQSFDGDLDGNLTVSGSGTFAGNVTLKDAFCGNSNPNQGTGTWMQASGGVFTTRPAGSTDAVFAAFQQGGAASPTVEMKADGNATFKGNVASDGTFVANNGSSFISISAVPFDSGTLVYGHWDGSGYLSAITATGAATFSGNINVGKPGSSAGGVQVSAAGYMYLRSYSNTGAVPVVDVYDSTNTPKTQIFADGSTRFAGGKAGFTSDGNLWCTTVRGDTVILDATSNGLASWTAYTPPTRRELLKEQIEDIKDAAIKPSQDLPETETGTQ